jgi:hypothetical protein
MEEAFESCIGETVNSYYSLSLNHEVVIISD